MIRHVPLARMRLALPRSRGLCTHIPQSEHIMIAAPTGLRVVDLHRPSALNALNAEMVSTLLPLVRDWQRTNGDLKMVVFRGSGPRAFCAGGDIRFLADCAAGEDASARQPAFDFFREEYALNHAIGTSRTPIVSLLEGIVMGGGVGLSVHGHVRVATESTMFAMPETGIGFFPDVGGTYFLPRLKGELGTYLGLTGARLKGRDVFTAGIATHFVPAERLPTLEALLLEFGSKPIWRGVEVLQTSLDALDAINEAEAAPASFVDAHAAEIDECFGRPTVAAIVKAVNAAAAAASSDDHWAVRAAKDLGRASPTSLEVTLEALRRGASCDSLGECLEMEFRIAQRFMRHPDFVTGVRAVMSKGAEPATWAPPPTSAAEIEEFFVAGEEGELALPTPPHMQ